LVRSPRPAHEVAHPSITQLQREEVAVKKDGLVGPGANMSGFLLARSSRFPPPQVTAKAWRPKCRSLGERLSSQSLRPRRAKQKSPRYHDFIPPSAGRVFGLGEIVVATGAPVRIIEVTHPRGLRNILVPSNNFF
jgi:hypothetical protein